MIWRSIEHASRERNVCMFTSTRISRSVSETKGTLAPGPRSLARSRASALLSRATAPSRPLRGGDIA